MCSHHKLCFRVSSSHWSLRPVPGTCPLKCIPAFMVTHECIKSSCCVFIIKQKTALKHHLHSVCVVYAGMSVVETEIINKSKIKPHEWKRYIDDVFSLWDKTREEIDQFIVEANRHHPTIKFMAEISDKETNFLDTTIFKGERFLKDSILDISRILNRLKSFNTRTCTLPVTFQV